MNETTTPDRMQPAPSTGRSTPRGARSEIPTGPEAWFGRPVHLELRILSEVRELRESPWWTGHGMPEGRGRPILLIPGFLAGPRSTKSIAQVLTAAGWTVAVADVGRNSGPAYLGVEAAETVLDELTGLHDEPVTVIGHSRGGQFARVLAVRYPERIRQIVVIGTPLTVKYPSFAPLLVPATVLDQIWRAGTFGEVFPDREHRVDTERWLPFPGDVDFVSVYSTNDGFVDWRTCREPAAIAIEVDASHRGLVNSVAGMQAIAHALNRQDRELTADDASSADPVAG